MHGTAEHPTSRRLVPALLALAVCGALSAPALGDPPEPRHEALLDSTVRFLQDSQRQNGGFAGSGEPSQGTSAWVALALAAAGINPRNQAQPCGTDAYAYLVAHFRQATGEEEAASEGQIATTAFERELMVVNASGTNPHDFAGFDLVREILERQLPDGSFPYVTGGSSQINTTVFAILALGPVHEPAVESAIAKAAEWLIAQQNNDGGWYWQGRGTLSEVDMTGAAIEALNAAGAPSEAARRDAFEAAQRKGFEYLEGAQLPEGGFPALPKSQSESNVASTAWAVQAIWSANHTPEAWRTGSGLASEEPLDYMESMQQPDGHIRWSQSQDVNGIWMTAYVVPAFAGQALPIPAATFADASVPPCDAGAESGNGVIAGGGGEGAPLFSRPKPQSRGRTPGGARLVPEESRHPHDHSETRRGSNAEQPTGTEASEPDGADAGKGKGTTAVFSSAGPGQGQGPGDPDAAGVRAGTGSGAGRAGAPVPATLREAAEDAPMGGGGREVSGTLIGDVSSAGGGKLDFGAPGLHSAGAGADPGPWVAAGIAGAALLVALGGARWERRHEGALP